jgi:DnaJ family protein C protein 2
MQFRRTEKRHIENKNRSERERRKKEDNTRRRNLVETALSLDPRMKRFKTEERLAREAKRKGPNASASTPATLSAEQIKEKEEAELKAKQELEKKNEESKSAKEAAKKAKEAAKKNLKKEKKTIQSIVTGSNYFLADGESVNASVIEGQLSELDLLFAALEPEEVSDLRKEMESNHGQGKPAVKAVLIRFAKKVSDANKASFKQFV